jgi:alkylation response protein AidB-like acyl-CoA dehydrogenase
MPSRTPAISNVSERSRHLRTSRGSACYRHGVFTQTADQELFETTTAQFLEATYPSARVRGVAKQDGAFDAEAWKQGAALGWTTLLVPEDSGGGSISGNGLVDLLIVAFQFGRHAAPGPLLGTNVVAAALGRWGSDDQRRGPLADLVDGRATAAWCPSATVDGVALAGRGVTGVRSRDTVVLDGTLPCVESATDATYLMVLAGAGEERSHYLVPAATPGVEAVPLQGVDLTRRYHRVSLRGVQVPATARVGAPGAGDTQGAALLDIVVTLQAAEIVGAMQRAFDMTLRWTADRYSFGRPLGSYQEIKHRVADLRTALEASGAVAAEAARAVGGDGAGASSWASAAKAYAGRFGPEVIQDCIQLHGGIGVTFDHDLHLFLRRAVVDAQLFGTPAEYGQRLVRLIEASSEGEA